MPETLRLVGLSTKLHNYPDQLSGGEQQRVSIARAFVNHPPLLLADEPSGNLDPVTSIGMMQLLYRINRTGTTVVVVTHDREMVDKMRRRVIELYEGRVVRDEHGGYTEESTTEFACGRDGRRREGQTNGTTPMRLDSSSSRRPSGRCAATRRRAWRRSSPRCVTVILLGRPDPGLPGRDQAKSEEVRDRLELEVSIDDDATQGRVAALRQHDPRRSPTSSSVEFITKAEALKILEERLGKEPSDDRGAARATRCPATSDQARRRRQRRRGRGQHSRRGPERRAAADQPGDRRGQGPRGRPEKIEQVTSALKIVLTSITALLVSPR